ncbi:hypothetical protein MMC15_007646 [Xylographa vitiligo]|nr:hypothetical protein [Xylographa vitiligo]
MAAPEAGRLQQLFSGPVAENPGRWSQLWDAGDFLPFDRGLPNPALEDTLTRREKLLGTATRYADESKRTTRKTALVPGCGRGYDVLLLASFGYDSYGLEISETAVQRCKEEYEKNGYKYPVKDGGVGAGRVVFIHGDFFDATTWKGDVESLRFPTKFDLIYDYTFLCALHPSMRPAWSKQMKSLLTTRGRLICLEFPSYKSLSAPGPPWALRPEVYLEHLGHPGQSIPYKESGEIEVDVSGPPEEGSLQRLAHWQPQRTHEIGKGTDWVSIWCSLSS